MNSSTVGYSFNIDIAASLLTCLSARLYQYQNNQDFV